MDEVLRSSSSVDRLGHPSFARNRVRRRGYNFHTTKIAEEQRRTTENYFRLEEDEWTLQPINDPTLHKQLVEGFKKAKLSLRDQIVVRMAYESGARIGEILLLTVGDWRKRGCNQEATAFSKGSHGRRVKVIRFDKTTAKMLRE